MIDEAMIVIATDFNWTLNLIDIYYVSDFVNSNKSKQFISDEIQIIFKLSILNM